MAALTAFPGVHPALSLPVSHSSSSSFSCALSSALASATASASSQLVQAMLARLPPASQTLMFAGLPTAASRLRAVKRKAEEDVAALLKEMQQRMLTIASNVQSSVANLDEAVIQAEQRACKRSKYHHIGSSGEAMDAKLMEQLWTVKCVIHALESRDGDKEDDEEDNEEDADEAYDSDGEGGDELMSDPVLLRMSFALWHIRLYDEYGKTDASVRRPVNMNVLFANRKVFEACKNACSGLHDFDEVHDDLVRAAAHKYLKPGDSVEDWDFGDDRAYGGCNGMMVWSHDETVLAIHRNKNTMVDLLVDFDVDKNIITSSRFFCEDVNPARSHPPMCEAAQASLSVAAVLPVA